MRSTISACAVFIMLFSLAACKPSATPLAPTSQPPVQEPNEDASPLPPADTPASPLLQPEEAIFIRQPAPGSRVTSPLTIEGFADSTFEQTLVVRLLLEDGTQIAIQPVIIQADIGQRGPFEAQLNFSITGERQAFIQVFTESPRDGQITHLSSVGITLSDAGPEQIKVAEPRAEQIQIIKPALGEKVTGGMLVVEGFGWAGFENSLVIQLQNQAGEVIAQQPVIVEALEMGQSGPFQAQLSYTISEEEPGRIVVRDISPAFGGDAHLNSVEIMLAP